MAELVPIRPPERGIPRPPRPNLRGLSFEELRDLVARRVGGPAYRSEQLFRWLHRERATSFEAMTNLPGELRHRLTELGSVDALAHRGVHRAADETRKLALRTPDGETIESVLIPNERRGYTLCISSQIGCALTCRFCATASLGFRRNLDTWEIVDQVYRALAELAREQDADDAPPARALTNLVYMGMGEPLHNFNQVKRSLAILTHPLGAALAPRRITVSTAGLVPGIRRFAREGLGARVGLAISLNATTDAIRDELMPINRRWNIAELLAAVAELPPGRRRDVTFEYVLLDGVNDGPEDVARLSHLLQGLPAHVNVIPFNPHPHAPFRRPAPARIDAFVAGLREGGLRAYLRSPRGDDISAACGQLAAEDAAPTDA